MRHLIIYTFLIYIFASLSVSHECAAQTDKLMPISSSKLSSIIKSSVKKQKSVYRWNQADEHTLWSAGIQTDSLYSIGFQPSEAPINFVKISQFDLTDETWQQSKYKLINTIREHFQSKHGSRYQEADIFPYGIQNRLPYVNAKIFDAELLSKIRALPTTSFIDVMTTAPIEKTYKSAGCGDVSASLNTADYSATSPGAIRSWHHSFNNLDCAWDDGYAGQGIWIAIMDTGVSPDQEKMNAEFAEGESSGRMVKKYNTYQSPVVQTTDWEDDCGHGTAMSGLAAAPKGFEGTAAGIAFRANLAVYRVTNDVVVNGADEKQGLTDAIMHAADDPNIKIISISLGDVFFNNQIALAIEYAYGKDKLIFAAAGTSTTLTSWYPVIFPANMLETIAVTGITDDTNRERCDICHDGPEVDYVVVMQRQNNGSRNAVTIAQPNNNNGYVSGSSAATASMAGFAAVTWSSDPSWTKDEVINRLTQASDNYPVRDNDFGWGIVDICQAADPVFSIPCSPLTANNVTMTITDICFPAASDTGSEAEWVLSFDGNSYYFDVPEVGACGPVNMYINTGACGSPPIIIPISATSCGENSSTVTIYSHENDGNEDCVLGFFDDYEYSNVETVSFSSYTITHNSPAGPIIITYTLSCMATTPPLFAGISVPEIACQNQSATADFFANGGQSPYTITYQINGGLDQTIVTTGNNASININTSNSTSTTYTLISVADANGCSQVTTGSESVMVIANPTISAAAFSTTSCLASDGSIEITTTGVPDGTYDINEANGILATIMIINGTGTISGLAAGNYNDLSISLNSCISTEYPDVIISDLPPSAPDQLTAIVTDLSAMLSWVEQGGANAWDIEIVIGLPTGIATHTSTSNIYQVFDLDPLTDYSFYVRADCGMGEVSAWSGPFDFSTDCHPDFAGMNQLINTQNGTVDYESDGFIESNQMIISPAQVDYDSKIEILMKAGFEVQVGAVFHAFIDGCEGID